MSATKGEFIFKPRCGVVLELPIYYTNYITNISEPTSLEKITIPAVTCELVTVRNSAAAIRL